MRLFGRSKQKNEEVYSVANGKAVPLAEVPDEAFAKEILGKGVGIIPSDSKIVAPADGVIESFFDTLHAFGMKADNGAELLVHVGIDTVKLKGEGFQGYVKVGDKVSKGDPIIEVDLDLVKGKGYETVTPIIILNTDNFSNIEFTLGEVKAGEKVISFNSADDSKQKKCKHCD